MIIPNLPPIPVLPPERVIVIREGDKRFGLIGRLVSRTGSGQPIILLPPSPGSTGLIRVVYDDHHIESIGPMTDEQVIAMNKENPS